jgi:hypothetical protein
MIERSGEVRIVMLENVQQDTIRPIIEETIELGAVVNTDEYVIYDALPRWVEQCHREGKQMLGIEKCQCRKARAQKNHIGCAILAWHCLTKLARKLKTNIYALKNSLLSEYLKEELKKPSIPMSFA